MAFKKSTSKELVNWEQELANEAEIAAKNEQKSGGAYLSARNGQLSFQGNPIAGNKLDVIILEHVYENAYYPGKFDPNNPSSPVCFASAKKEVDLIPSSEDCDDVQNETCEGCPQNEFGTADTGRGKACKNSRKLSLITADSLDDIENAQVALMNLPATSVKAWATYVQQLALTVKRPTYAVITQISVVPDVKTQFKIGFKLVSSISQSSLAELRAKREANESLLFIPYQKNSERPEPASPKKASNKGLAAKRNKFK